jgi:acyl carrier protein
MSSTATDLVTLISRCIGEVLRSDPPELTEDTELPGDTGLDSLSTLELLMALEEATGVKFDPDIVDLGRFGTVGALTDFVAGVPL